MSMAFCMTLYVGNIDTNKCNRCEQTAGVCVYRGVYAALATNAELFCPGHAPRPAEDTHQAYPL